MMIKMNNGNITMVVEDRCLIEQVSVGLTELNTRRCLDVISCIIRNRVSDVGLVGGDTYPPVWIQGI